MLQKTPLRALSWKTLWRPWRAIDLPLLILVVGLSVFGGVMIRSTELTGGGNEWLQHLIISGVGLGVALSLARCRYEAIMQWHWAIYGATNLTLLAVVFFGTRALGARRWIDIAGFNFQPSEFAKLGMIITLAALLAGQSKVNLLTLGRILGITALPWALVFVQPDLGTSLVFGAITFGMLYWGNTNPGWLVLILSPLVSAVLFNASIPAWLIWVALMGLTGWLTFPWPLIGSLGGLSINLIGGEVGHLLWRLLKGYQKERLTLFLNPDQDPLGGGYHLIQSRIAIGAGQLWGEGLDRGTQTQLHFIPEQHTDFIFSAVGEELGFVGALFLLSAFWLVCLRLVIIAQNAGDRFGSLLAIGVLSMIVFQVVINIGMTIGLAPVTGIPLPWISYGRSALLMNFVAIGLVEAVANSRRRNRFAALS